MYIITGGAGFIGSVLARELNSLGEDKIIIVDNLGSDQKWKNLLGLKFLDIWTPEQLLSAEKHNDWRDIKIVFHMGACSATTEQNVDFLLENNYRYSQKIFEKCTHKKIPLIYASSAATYGSGENGYDDQHANLSSLAPLNPYGLSKKLFDDWVLLQKEKPPMWFGLKFFNVFGPYEYHKNSMVSVPYSAFHQAKKNGVIKLFKSYNKNYADGLQMRDFVYVWDVAKAMIEFSKLSNCLKSGIYNMGTGLPRSFNDLAKAVFSSMGLEQNIQYIDMPESLKNQYQYYTKANMEKFNNVFPHFTFRSLEDSIHDYIHNYLK